MAGHSTLIKAVLSSVVIYFITVLDVPLEVILKIDSNRQAYLWAANEFKVNWEKVCKPQDYGGLGLLNLKKFASTLRLRWLWYEWNEDPKPWLGLGTPCTNNDSDLFEAVTKVTIGNGKKALFWESSWLRGWRPKGLAPLIYDI